MRYLIGFCTLAVASSSFAQAPPMTLPSSILGKSAPQNLTPAAAVVAKPPPIARYPNLANVAPETAQAVLGMRTGAEWLARRQLAHGKFLFGVNPTLRTPLEGDSEFRQAIATWAVCQAAAFTFDEKLTACGGQAILTLLAQTKDDATDATLRVPTIPAGSGDAVGYAACLVLAIEALPSADAKLLNEAEKLSNFLRKQIRADGGVTCGDANDPDAVNVYPGLALQALALNARRKPAAGKYEAIAKGLGYYRAAFRAKPHPSLAGTILPAAVEVYIDTRSADVAAIAVEMGDWLCAAQLGKSDPHLVLLAGGFRTSPTNEPSFETAHALRGLAAATHLSRQIPDPARYAKYRPATVEAIRFMRGLQYTADNTTHFTGEFRSQYLIGGVRTGTTDGNIRSDATALSLVAFQRFLESGADGRE